MGDNKCDADAVDALRLVDTGGGSVGKGGAFADASCGGSAATVGGMPPASCKWADVGSRECSKDMGECVSLAAAAATTAGARSDAVAGASSPPAAALTGTTSAGGSRPGAGAGVDATTGAGGSERTGAGTLVAAVMAEKWACSAGQKPLIHGSTTPSKPVASSAVPM